MSFLSMVVVLLNKCESFGYSVMGFSLYGGLYELKNDFGGIRNKVRTL